MTKRNTSQLRKKWEEENREFGKTIGEKTSQLGEKIGEENRKKG